MKYKYLKLCISFIVCFICLLSLYFGESYSEVGSVHDLAYKSEHDGKNASENSNPANRPESFNNQFENSTVSKSIKIFGSTNALEEMTSLGKSIEETDRLINDFFSYLDDQGYIRSYNLSGGSRNQFFQICRTLLADSPVTIRETDSLRYLVKNVYFFYRTLGKKKIILINDVLKNESDIVEPLMRLFYLWFTAHGRDYSDYMACPSFEQMYEYVSFFLETMGGRSYLFRRDPRIRIVAQYYCVLMIDEANDQGHNPNGIDIRPHVRHMLAEISEQRGLIYKDQYLTALERLRQKYDRS